MKLNEQSIRTRIRKLEQYINELESLQSFTIQKFRSDFTAQLATERAFQAAIECCTDIASHIVSVYSLGQPQVQRDLFRFLDTAGYLDEAFAQTMGDMVGLRNRLVHLYWDVDVDRLYAYLQEDVIHLERFRDFSWAILASEIEIDADEQD